MAHLWSFFAIHLSMALSIHSPEPAPAKIHFYRNTWNGLLEEEMTLKKFTIITVINIIQWIVSTNILFEQIQNYGNVCATRYNFGIGTIFSSSLIAPMLLQLLKGLWEYYLCVTKNKLHEKPIELLVKTLIALTELGLTVTTVWSSVMIVSATETILDLILNCTAITVVRELDDMIFQHIIVPLNAENRDSLITESRLSETFKLDYEKFPGLKYLLVSLCVYLLTFWAWIACYSADGSS